MLGTAGLIAAGIIVAAIVIGGIVPRRLLADDRDLARWIGKRQPGVASDLLSAIELRAAPARIGAPSSALVDALVDATGDKLA